MADIRPDDLEQVLERFGEAWAVGDLAVLDRLLSPTYSHVDAGGALFDRAGWLAYAGGRSGRDTRIAFHDVSIRTTGDVAIITGVNDISGDGIRSSADTQRLSLRFTQVWIWQDGRWLREAFQATPVAPAGSAFS